MPKKKPTLTPSQANFVLSGQLVTLERMKKTFTGELFILREIQEIQQGIKTLKYYIKKGDSS